MISFRTMSITCSIKAIADVIVLFRLEIDMLGWALAFFILAIVAGFLGFGGIAGASAGIAQLLFAVFLVLMIVSFFARALRGRSVL